MAGARLLEARPGSKQLSLVEELKHPGRTPDDSEIDTDRPGRAFSSAGAGGGHLVNREVLASERTGGERAQGSPHGARFPKPRIGG